MIATREVVISDTEYAQIKYQEKSEEREITSKFAEQGWRTNAEFMKEIKVEQCPEERQGVQRDN